MSGIDKAEFIDRIRSLYNIDGDLLPELTPEQQLAFVSDPVRYFIYAGDTHSAAIWREVEKRQEDNRIFVVG